MTCLDKIQTVDQAIAMRNFWKQEGKRVVFTNGCFDILHRGHVIYLEKARSLGDVLIVGLNSDASVKRLKGESRPIKGIENRAALLSAFGFVDCVVAFAEDTPEALIQSMRPDVLVKGGDYAIEDIVGGEFVKELGGEVMTIDFVDGESSSRLIRKLEGK